MSVTALMDSSPFILNMINMIHSYDSGRFTWHNTRWSEYKQFSPHVHWSIMYQCWSSGFVSFLEIILQGLTPASTRQNWVITKYITASILPAEFLKQSNKRVSWAAWTLRRGASQPPGSHPASSHEPHVSVMWQSIDSAAERKK